MDQPPLIPPLPPTDTAALPRTSLAARLLNVFAIPGQVFEEVKLAHHKAGNWVVPTLIAAIVGVLWVLIMVSQPAFQSQVRQKLDQHAKVMDGQVKKGEVSRQDADRVMRLLQIVVQPAVLKALGSAVTLLACCGRLFGWALVIWLLGLWFLKVRFNYLKALEVAGLASMIAILGTIVSLLLMTNLGKDAGLETSVLDLNSGGKNNLLLGVSNVFSFWHLGAMGCGLARLAGVPFMRAMFLLLTAWILLVLLVTGFAGLGSSLL